MYRTFFVLLAGAIISTLGGPVAAQDIDVGNCDRNRNSLIERGELKVIARHQADPMLRKYDTNCNGRLDPSELEQYYKDLDDKAAIYERHLAKKFPKTATPLEQVKGAVAPEEEARVGPPFLIRDAYSQYSITNPPTPRNMASGAHFSYTRDLRTQNEILSATGAILGYFYQPYQPDDKSGLYAAGVRSIVAVPGVEFDRKINRNDPSDSVNYLGFRFIGEVETESNGPFTSNYFRTSAYLKSDFGFRSKIAGFDADWEPRNVAIGVGAGHKIPGIPVLFRWQPTVHAEYEKVVEAGNVPKVMTGDEFFRAGPTLQVNFWIISGFLEGLSLEAQYRYLWTVFGPASETHRQYLQVVAGYPIDKAGNIAVEAKYRNGRTPGNGSEVHDYTLGLSVRF